ncbi:MAG: hypothetical protein JOY69_03505 [Candidatus Eremiobacteraeota bacterium]|nr:hypothetical protein [Candidatus Eremiobacteraeota bacterium]
MAWTLELPQLAVPKDPSALADAGPLLQRLIDAFGQNAVARLLNVNNATVARWRARQRKMDPEHTKRVIDLHDVLNRAFQVFAPETAMRWLVGAEPFLDHKRPVDVLVLEGAAPLVAALDAIDATAYA